MKNNIHIKIILKSKKKIKMSQVKMTKDIFSVGFVIQAFPSSCSHTHTQKTFISYSFGLLTKLDQLDRTSCNCGVYIGGGLALKRSVHCDWLCLRRRSALLMYK